MADAGREMRIYTYPHPVLRQKAGTVEEIDQEIQALVDDMIRTMYAAPGIGLAANQIGKPIRVIVFDVREGNDQRRPRVLINPRIVEEEGEIVYEESCLSVVDFSAEVSRSGRVLVEGVDRHGKPQRIEAEGIAAVCLQHEIDHLDGKLFIDHISSLKRSLYKKRLKKMQKSMG